MPVPVAARALAVSLTLALGATACAGSEPTAKDSRRPSAKTTHKPKPKPTYGEKRARSMTLRQKAGQVIVTKYAGTGSPARLVKQLHLGGVIVMGGNVASTGQVKHSNRQVRRVVRKRGYPAFIGVDQEGGIVSRIHSPVTSFPAFMSAGAADDVALTTRAARASAREMRALGFDVVFAPVADVSIGASDAAIGSRAAGGRPGLVARHVVAAAQGIEQAGVLPVVKHFPGHGSLSDDSHLVTPVQRRSMKQLRRVDLVPFAAAIKAGAPAIMTGHIEVNAVDRSKPASISRKVTTGLLRHQMGYDGLVVTDGLDMRGVQRQAPNGRAAVRALVAGADVVLMPPDPRDARNRIVRAVRHGILSRNRLNDAVARMIDTLRAIDTGRRGRVGAGEAASGALSRAALTSVAGPCRGRLVPGRVRVTGPAAATGYLRELLDAGGVSIARDTYKSVKVGTRKKIVGYKRKKVEVTKIVDGKKKTVTVKRKVPVKKRVPIYKKVLVPADAPTVALVGFRGGAPGSADIVVALDRPSVLGRVSARVKLAAYGENGGAIRAVSKVLLGQEKAPGHLPIRVPGVSRDGC